MNARIQARIFSCYHHGKSAQQESTDLNRALSNLEYSNSMNALKSGTSYLMGEEAGHMIDLGPKYDSMKADVIEATGASGSSGDASFAGRSADVGKQAAARALGLSGVASQKLGQGMDELNKLRNTLASHGLRTTSLGAQAGGLQAEAVSMLPTENQKVSQVMGALGSAAAIYGGAKNAMAAKQTGIPGEQVQAGSPFSQSFGSDVSYLTGGLSESGTTPGLM